MVSEKIQLIIIIIILAYVLVWVILKLIRKHPQNSGGCSCCGNASDCKARELMENKSGKQRQCDNFSRREKRDC